MMCGIGAMSGLGVAANLLTTALMAAAIITVVWLTSRAARPHASTRPTLHDWPPLQAVKDRYARGDIDDDQLDRELDRLLRHPGSPT